MKTIKKLVAIVISLAMITVLGACGSKDFNAQGYVKALLDASYHGEYEEYAKYRNMTEEEAKQEVESTMAANMATASIGGTEEEEKQFNDDMMKCYALAKYEVGPATKDKDGNFTCTVTYEPITAFADFSAGLEAYLTENMDSISEDNYASQVLTYLEQCIDNNSYSEKATMDISVEKSKDTEVYSVPDDQMSALEMAVMGLE